MVIRNTLISLLMVAVTVIAHAQETRSGATTSNSPQDELQRITDDTVLMKARLDQVEAQLKLLQQQQAVRKLQEQSGNYGQPVLRGIEGMGNNLIATFSMGDGAPESVSVGGHFHGYTVVTIQPVQAILTRGKERITLTTSAAARSQSGTQTNTTTPGGIGIPTN